MTSLSKWSVCCGLLLLALLVYFPRPEMGFVLDDQYVIERNPVIKNPALYPQIFTTGLFDAARSVAEGQLNYYRPLLTASFALDYAVWGLNPSGYRLTNLLIHTLNSFLVFWLIFLFFRRQRLAVFAALIFCVLPVHEWAVRYITGRGDLLQATFSLLSLITLTVHLSSRKKRFLVLSVLAFMAALLCREVTALNLLYVALVAVKFSEDNRQRWLMVVLFVGVVAGYYAWRALTFPVFGLGLIDNLVSNLRDGIPLGLSFLSHFLVPSMAAAYAPAGTGFAASAVLMAALAALMLRRDEEHRWFLAGLIAAAFVILVMTLVMARVIEGHIGPVMSEHFLYFPSIGFALLAAFWMDQMPSRSGRYVVLAFFMIYFTGLSVVSGWFWKHEERLLRNVKRIEGPQLTLFDQQLAMKYEDDLEKIAGLAHAAEHPPKKSMWLKRMGNIFHQQKDYVQAEAFLQYAVAVDPLNFEAWNELGVVYLETGRVEAGLECFEKSLEAKPNVPDTVRLKGVALYWRRDYDAAITLLRQSLAHDPDQQEAWQYLMMAHYFLDHREDYQRSVDEIIARFRDLPSALKFTVWELLENGRHAEALEIFARHREVFEQDPAFSDVVSLARQQGVPHE